MLKKTFSFLIIDFLFSILMAQSVANLYKGGNITPLDLSPKDEIIFYPSPAMDLKTSVKQAGWIDKDKFFTLTDDEACIMDITNNIRETVDSIEGKIIFMEAARKSKSSVKEIFTLTETNKISVRKYPLKERYSSKNLDPDSPITSATFAPDGTYIATGHKNGKILISMPLVLSGNIYKTDFYVKSKEITSLQFSPDSKLLACMSKGGIIDIWNMENGTLYKSVKTKKKSPYPVYFSADSKHIISALNSKTLIEQSFYGDTTRKFSLEHKIKTFHVSDEGKYIFELSENNNIYVYNADSKKLLGYIPFFSKSEIMDFSFSEDYEKVLVVHECGIIFILNVRDVFLDPGTPQPRIASGDYYGGTGAGKGTGGEISSDIGVHNLDIRLDLSKPSNPYLLSMTPEIAYIYSPLHSNFYFGAMVEGNFTIPNPSFPYLYVDLSTGKTMHNPYITGPKLSGIAGIYFKPTEIDLGLFLEFRGSGSVYTFYFPEYGIKDYYPGFNAELQAGFVWKQLLFFIGGLYDYRLGFSVSGGTGFRIRIGSG